MDRTFWLFFLTLTAGCACGDGEGDTDADADTDSDTDSDSDSDTDSDTGTEVCDADAPPADDEIVPELVADMPGDALAVATDWTTAIVCGMDFALAVDLASGDLSPSVAIDAPCTGAAIDGGRAAIVDKTGRLVLFDVGAGPALAEVDRSETPGSVYEDVLLSGGVALVAARTDGIVRFDASGATLSPLPAWIEVTDARAIASDGSGFAVADGVNGARLLDDAGTTTSTLALIEITSPVEEEGGLVDVTLPWEGESITTNDSWIVVGSGAYGYSWRAKSGGDVHAIGRPYFAEGPVFDVALDSDDRFVYAEAGSIRRMRIDGDGTIARSASEIRRGHGSIDGGFWIDVAAQSGEALLLATDALFRASLGEHVPAPDLDVEKQSLYALAAVGATAPAAIVLRNYGDLGLSLVLDSMAPDSMDAFFLDLAGLDVPDENGCLLLPAGGAGGSLQVNFTPADTAPVEGTLVLGSNDVDEPAPTFPVHGNPDEVGLGDLAPDFVLTTLEGETFRRSDHDGEVLLLMFYNST